MHSNEVIVITGASAGVGRATARAFAAQGASVALLARGRDGLAAAAEEVRSLGGTALVIPVDVSDATAVESAAEKIEEELGPIDVWVNNAMTAILAPVAETSADDFRRVTEVTYLGCVHGTLSALRRMKTRDRGTIVQVGSALAHRAIPLQASYCGAKHAIRGFTESLRCELLHDKSNVKVTMVQLPGLNTPQFGWVKTTLRRHPQPVPPIYQPEAAARAIVWAAHHPRREYYVGAPTPLTIWAGRLAPAIVDRYLAATNIDAQQTDTAIGANRAHYLNEALDDASGSDRGAHGVFGDSAHPRSLLFEIDRWRHHLLGAATVAATVTAARCVLRAGS
ncbi:MAG: SDR family oxidoreductase [Actinomycetota bacterium]|nr:SDR family oxidoreductase [Actinomycetota bacterium]